MSQVFICVVCNNIYKKENIKKDKNGISFCPNRRSSCGSNLISVDENLAEIILIFWNLELETCSSCEGHPYDLSTPYISFCENNTGEYILRIEELRDLFLKFNKNNDNFLTISEIKKTSMRPSSSWYHGYIDYKQFLISVDPNTEDPSKLSVSEKLELKYDFINILYAFIAEFQEKMEGNHL